MTGPGEPATGSKETVAAVAGDAGADRLGPSGGRPVLPPPGSDPGPFFAALAAAGEPTVLVARDPSELAEASAVQVVDLLVEALGRRGRADVALTGGSTPRAMYRRLVEPRLRDRVAWDRVHLWWGDDRFVPRADPHSNVFLADAGLLVPGGIPVPDGNVHPFPTDRAIRDGLGAGWCAATYATEVVESVPLVEGWPAFDVVLVGIGPDGHLLSVFPGSPALASDRVGLGIAAPGHVEPHVERVTLNPAILGVARRVLATAAGAGKAAVVARILEAERDPATLPAVLARRSTATWLLDAPAAGTLRAQADRVVLRRAAGTDAFAIANVWLAAFAATYDFPHAHTDDEVRRWIRDDLLRETETWVAADPDGSIAGFMALTPDMVDQLYIRPNRTGRGIGSRLIALAKVLRPAGLDLYTFQANTGARRFYERHGFGAVAFDDEGAGNEEHQPDVRYRWRPTDPTAS
jgi:6-phosphogluconolactonase